MQTIEELQRKRDFSCTGMQIILKMIESGVYQMGEVHRLGYYQDLHHIGLDSFSEKDLTDDICHFLISYGKCKFKDIPEKARTRDFFLNAFPDKDVYDYVINHINEFDREFFRDLIATDHYALCFSNNAFEAMPLEYIDSEMIDLAFLSANNWSDSDWFQSVVRRKPEAISYQGWLCAARYFTSVYNILDVIPEEYKTEILYLEIMSCCYNCGMSLRREKEKTIEHIPEAIFTEDFLKKVLSLDIENIGRIPEKYMDVVLDFKGKLFKVWEVGIIAEPKTIDLIKPNWERIEFFKKVYGDDSFYYNLYCKDVEEKFQPA